MHDKCINELAMSMSMLVSNLPWVKINLCIESFQKYSEIEKKLKKENDGFEFRFNQ